MATGNNNNNNNKGQIQESNPTPLTNRDYVIGNESYDSVNDVKNSMPAPSNPNQGGQKDKK